MRYVNRILNYPALMKLSYSQRGTLTLNVLLVFPSCTLNSSY